MTNNSGGLSCAVGTWLVAFLAGIAVAALLMVIGGWSFIQGVFIGLLAFLVLGGFLSWTLCRPLPAPGAQHAGATAGASSGKPATPAPKPAATAAPATSAATAPETKMEPEKTEAPKAEPAPAPEPAPEPTPEPAKTSESATGQSKPEGLSEPREGGADDLKRIKGVGPKLEGLLHSMGYYHFDQIAGWSSNEVAWVDENLEGFKGRVTRDNWVEQARLLAGGGETDFSKRVDKGDVY